MNELVTTEGYTDSEAVVFKPARELLPTGIGKLTGAISAVMSEIGVVGKDGINRFHNYKYAQMGDVLQALTPLLAKHGLVIFQTEAGRTMFDDNRAVAVQYQFAVAHASGEVWPERLLQTGLCRCRDSKGGFDDKALAKCHTQARKYFLMALFQIPTGDVDDSDDGRNDGPQPANRVAPPAPPLKTITPEAKQHATEEATRQGILTPAERAAQERIDPQTGEVLPAERRKPREIDYVLDAEGLSDWVAWGAEYIKAIQGCAMVEEAFAWRDCNEVKIADMKQENPRAYKIAAANVKAAFERLGNAVKNAEGNRQ